MRTIDESGNEVYNPDLTAGYLAETRIIKDAATPIDNIKKFAWDDEDYETVRLYVRYTESDLSEQRKQDAFAEEVRRRNDIVDTAPTEIKKAQKAAGESQTAIAELGVLASDSAMTIDDIMVAVAELGAIVTNGVRNG